jgi:hypothetical protein
MNQTIKILPSPSVPSETIDNKTEKFRDLIQRKTQLSFLTGSCDVNDNVNFFSEDIRKSNSFISCVLECYNKHISLKISPDVIYIAILIQFCTYVNTRSNKSTNQKFFKGDINKKFEFHYVSGDETDIKTFDFEKMFHSFSTKVQSNLINPKLVDIFDCNFSTSTKKDKMVAKFLLAATLKDYYSYYGYPCCGIPQIEIVGNKQDWQLILENCKQLEQYDYDDGELILWLKLIYPIIEQFVNVYDDKDPSTNDFWSQIVRHITGGSGVDHIDGWLTAFTYFRLGCHQNYTLKLGDHIPFSLIHNGEKINYPFIHYNLIANGNVSFNVDMIGWNTIPIKAEINVGQFFYSIDNEQLKPENDWFVVADTFKNATQKFFPDSNWCNNLQCELNQNKDHTYFKTIDQVLKLLEPIYQPGHWEQPKFIEGPIADFLHFFVASVDQCYVEAEKCVKCYQKGSFLVEVFEGVKCVDSFSIERAPLESCIEDCVGAPYIIPVLRQWLKNNYEFTGFPMFKNADNGRTSLGHIIYNSMNRPMDGTMLMLRLEIPLSKMKKTHPEKHYDHSAIDQFNKFICVCSLKSILLPSYKPKVTLQFLIKSINRCEEYPIMTPEEFKSNKCWYCLPNHAFQMSVLLDNKMIDKLVIISEKSLDTHYPFQPYQYIYQWLLNNIIFDSATLNQFNLMPVKLSSPSNYFFTFYLDDAKRVIISNSKNHHNLPFWQITDESAKAFRRALCHCDETNVLNLDLLIDDHPIFKDKCSLEWKITTKSFDHEEHHIQLPHKKIGSLTIEKNLDPLIVLSSTFNFDSTQLNLTNVDQMFKTHHFDIPLKICKENFKFEFN